MYLELKKDYSLSVNRIKDLGVRLMWIYLLAGTRFQAAGDPSEEDDVAAAHENKADSSRHRHRSGSDHSSVHLWWLQVCCKKWSDTHLILSKTSISFKFSFYTHESSLCCSGTDCLYSSVFLEEFSDPVAQHCDILCTDNFEDSWSIMLCIRVKPDILNPFA